MTGVFIKRETRHRDREAHRRNGAGRHRQRPEWCSRKPGDDKDSQPPTEGPISFTDTLCHPLTFIYIAFV